MGTAGLDLPADKGVPCLNRCCGVHKRRGCRTRIVHNTFRARDDVPNKRCILATYDGDFPSMDPVRLLPNTNSRANVSACRRQLSLGLVGVGSEFNCTCRNWVLRRDQMPCVVEEDVRPAAFLVDDTPRVAGVVGPRSGRVASKTLDAAEGGILYCVRGYNMYIPRRRNELGLLLDDSISLRNITDRTKLTPSVPLWATRASLFPEYKITEIFCAVALVASSDRKTVGLR
jgi:hypothetical protein